MIRRFLCRIGIHTFGVQSLGVSKGRLHFRCKGCQRSYSEAW